MGEMGEGKKKWRVGVVKMLFAVMLGMILIPSLILAVQPVGMKSQTAEVSIQDATVAQGESVEVPINITNVTDLGATTIWLSYNSSVVTVEEVREGTLGSLTFGINNTAGVTKMSWFSMTGTGKTGDFVFAYVRLKAVGSPGDVSVLDLDVKMMVDSKNEPINHTVRDGIFTVKLNQPTIFVKTDKTTYTPGDTMNLKICMKNEGENKTVMFGLWLTIPKLRYARVIKYEQIVLPAGYDDCIGGPIPVRDWGDSGFAGFWGAGLFEPSTGAFIDFDTAAWNYMPLKTTRIENAEKDEKMKISEEIVKQVRRIM